MKNKLINEASSWVGYLEKRSNTQLANFTSNAGNKNYTIFAKWYNDFFGDNFQGQAWCAMFVSCCFYRVFKDDRIMPHFAYCPTGVNLFKSMKSWFDKNPEPGDVIFFTNGKRAYHTGIVYKVDNIKVYTIEGNTSSASGVVENGGAVAKKSYSLNDSKILGYGRPLWKFAKTSATMTKVNSYGKVNATKLNVRCEPTTASDKVGTIGLNSFVAITGKTDGWYRIDYLGKSRFVSSSYIDIVHNKQFNAIEEIVNDLRNRGILSDSSLWTSLFATDNNYFYLGQKICYYLATKNFTEESNNEYTEVDHIIWELQHRKIITDTPYWENELNTNSNIYWLCRKAVQYIRTH